MTQIARALKPALTPTHARNVLERLAAHLDRVVQGKGKQTRLTATCVVAGGHLLLEDVPGVGKTTLAEALARSCNLSFSRVQFTADLMPTDILGAQVFHAATATFSFRPGPVFRQLVLADELNRAPPRTQSALLEAMAQGQVSLDGSTHRLPDPFTVVATQNPVDLSGTYPLPDSQLDRFLMRLSLGHPAAEVEAQLLVSGHTQNPDALSAVTHPEELGELRGLVQRQTVEESLAAYMVQLATAARLHPEVERGPSTRATLALASAARAHALWEARDFVVPADVQAVLLPVFAHRLLLRSAVQGAASRDEAGHVLEEIFRKVAAPR